MFDTLIKNMKKQVNPQALNEARKATEIQKKDRPRQFVMIAFDQTR